MRTTDQTIYEIDLDKLGITTAEFQELRAWVTRRDKALESGSDPLDVIMPNGKRARDCSPTYISEIHDRMNDICDAIGRPALN